VYCYYKKCLDFIENATEPGGLYDGIRAILKEADDRGRYPEDWHIKTIQRAADAKYIKLTEAQQ
jgi:hypothetical protein